MSSLPKDTYRDPKPIINTDEDTLPSAFTDESTKTSRSKFTLPTPDNSAVNSPARHASPPHFKMNKPIPLNQGTIGTTLPSSMPLRGQKGSPKTFKGDYREIGRFINHIEKLFSKHQVLTDQERCEAVLEYCSMGVEDFIRQCINFVHPNWNLLRDELLKFYDAEKLTSKYEYADLQRFILRHHKKKCQSLSKWKEYYRKYITIAGQLKEQGVLSDRDYRAYFWKGLPKGLQKRLEVKLHSLDPTWDMSQPYNVADILTVADSHFLRNKFTDTTLTAYDLKHLSDFEGDETDSESSDSEESSSEEEEYHSRRKLHRKKKLRKSRKDLSSSSDEEERHPRKKKTSISSLEKIILQLNAMSLQDPNYPLLYF